MPDRIATAEIFLWKHRVGAVAEQDNGIITFEYDPEFVRLGLEISPVHLPLKLLGPVTFPELQRVEAFDGLPGVIADALPDRFGNAVIKKYFSDRGRPDAALSPVQKLLYIGHRALGALEFRPALRLQPTTAEKESLEVSELVAQARRVVEGRVDVAIPEIMRVGASAGGARAKALILWNRDTHTVRSGFATPRQGDESWLIKFDGVGDLAAPNAKAQPYNRVEYAYSRMARDAGIHIPETELLRDRQFAHFMVQRFDRQGKTRLHMHSLGGLHHVDFNTPGLFSYEQYLRTVLTLELGYESMEEAYRRIAFNIMAVNQDDHVKNFSFLMNQDGKWSLSPAYDLTFAKGQGFTRVHQMTLAGKSDGFTRQDLLDAGARFDIKHDGRAVIDRVADALGHWSRYAKEAGVPPALVQSIGSQFQIH